MKLEAFRFIDMNNNTYYGKPDQLSYDPIQPHESSSGTYSGGEPQEVVLEQSHWTIVKILIQAIIDNESIHMEQRQMLTSRLQVTIDGQKQSWIIRRSEEQAAFNAYLKQVLAC